VAFGPWRRGRGPHLVPNDLNTEKAPIKNVYILRGFWPVSKLYFHIPALLRTPPVDFICINSTTHETYALVRVCL
jgi:hypothetical protein